MPLDEDLMPCTVCGEPVLWGTRHPACGQRVMEAEARVDALLHAIKARMQEHEAAANDPANAESHRRRAKTRYGEAQAIHDLVRAAFGVAGTGHQSSPPSVPHGSPMGGED